MAADVVIRLASRADRAAVLRFHRELYIRYRDRIMDAALAPLYAYKDLDSALVDDVDAILHGPTSTALIAERDGVPVGYITGHIENDERRLLPRKGVIEDWFVEEPERGTGVGRALLEALLEKFREAGCQVAESATWAFNTGARNAHRRLAFEEIEVRYRKRL